MSGLWFAPRLIAKEGNDGWIVADEGQILVSLPLKIGTVASAKLFGGNALEKTKLHTSTFQMFTKGLRIV